MQESMRTRLMRWGFNLFPVYRRTGGKVTFISDEFRHIHIKIPLNWKTRNYVGTMFGGSMYGATDPIYMIMFMKILGPKYVVWDKAGKIRYKTPGRSTLRGNFSVEDAEIELIRRELEMKEKLDRVYNVSLIDENGVECAMIEKTLHFSKKK
ncbi:MAG: DUF4442 domain-containing protein [Deferribacteres bacterium]|nr:DUF4442 domain-containing protein [candidate division KSB1 bacterium]MCB9500292.1 DUF4442 domain-containing protein [Deferribacteres bacterium]